jgi:hypothetical protein
MTDNTLATVGTPFALRALVPVSVGCLTVNLYPVIDHTMLVHERAHAFQLHKTALASQALDLRVMLNALGDQLKLSTSAKGIIKEWFWFFQDCWFDFCLLQILSFHNDAGSQVNNTTTDADPAVLLPVQNSTLNECRKAIKFVCVQLTLNYRQLANVNPPGPPVLKATYYIKLPLSLHGLTNSNNHIIAFLRSVVPMTSVC